VGVSGCEEVDELGIQDNRCRAIAFGYPLRNMGTDLCEPKKSTERIILTGTTGFCVHSKSTQ
jgi:hypothetical protein